MQVKYKLCVVKSGQIDVRFNRLLRYEDMKNKKIKVFCGTAVLLFLITLISNVAAEEIIIQKEKIAYEKCLKVITTSEDKLSIGPDIKEVFDRKLVAVFVLVDGTLTITCDRTKGEMTVSTNTN